MHRFAMLWIMETDDPALTEDAIDRALETAAGATHIRRLLIKAIPTSGVELLAVLPAESAEPLMRLHERIDRELSEDAIAIRPPKRYV